MEGACSRLLHGISSSITQVAYSKCLCKLSFKCGKPFMKYYVHTCFRTFATAIPTCFYTLLVVTCSFLLWLVQLFNLSTTPQGYSRTHCFSWYMHTDKDFFKVTELCNFCPRAISSISFPNA